MISNILKNNIFRYLKNHLILIAQRLKFKIKYSKPFNYKINFITEKKNWSIKWDGEYIKSSIKKNLNKDLVFLSNFSSWFRKKSISFWITIYVARLGKNPK